MEKELQLTDLIDVETLQLIQDAFSRLTGMAANIKNKQGEYVTQYSNCTDFYKKYILKNIENGLIDKDRVTLTEEKNIRITIRYSFLVEMIADITNGDELIGTFYGNQILTEIPDDGTLEMLANKFGAEKDEFEAGLRELPVLDEKQLKVAKESLLSFADVISHMSHSKYVMMVGNEELERVAKMKSDFLANMSHEIRTPMNAVIGMAELALREELPPNARDYVNQIISSGKTLLTIINDILDFSKIDSGKMDIIETDYSMFEMLHDMENILLTRIGEKNLELIFDIAPDVPITMSGDESRIKQIITNLANNAIKFTKEGKVQLSIRCEKIDDESVMIYGDVIDTGMGIKKEDLNKLFQSFQQVDSKRNRNIEGTGLGLAITKQLLTLMGGEISVSSEYGEGSVFSFKLPQKVVDWTPSVKPLEEKYKMALLFKHEYVKQQAVKDVEALNIEYNMLDSIEDLSFCEDCDFILMDMSSFSEKLEYYLMKHPNQKCIVMAESKAQMQFQMSNIQTIKRPAHIEKIRAAITGESIVSGEGKAYDDFTFTAPEANVLIVDDSTINLKVAVGLLEPLKMKVDTATSGKDAIYKISDKHYDLIFMDHMMPELDGVETTRIIRRFHSDYKDVPIIALTANVVEGTSEMFKSEEMNDLVAKPIDVKIITQKVREWLPQNMIVKTEPKKEEYVISYEVAPDGLSIIEVKTKVEDSGNSEDTANADSSAEAEKKGRSLLILPSSIEPKKALEMLGSEDLYWDILEDYYKRIDKTAEKIKKLETDNDLPNYAIEVHALKSSSRQIGAMYLGELNEALEKAGKANDVEFVHKKTGWMIATYMQLKNELSTIFGENDNSGDKPEIDRDRLINMLLRLQAAVDDMDLDVMDEIVAELEEYSYNEKESEYFEQLKNAVSDIEYDLCKEIIDKWCS